MDGVWEEYEGLVDTEEFLSDLDDAQFLRLVSMAGMDFEGTQHYLGERFTDLQQLLKVLTEHRLLKRALQVKRIIDGQS